MTILARLKKRWQILVAALTQDWHEHHCPACRELWFCQSGLCKGQLCSPCEASEFERWRLARTAKVAR